MYLQHVAWGDLGLFTRYGKRAGYGEYILYEKGMKIQSLYVKSRYRRRGYATLILQELARLCLQRGGSYLYLDSTTDLPIYERLGFLWVRPYDNEMMARARH